MQAAAWMLRLAVLLLTVRTASGFRILNSSSELQQAGPAVFTPYAAGHVGYYGDPANPDPERVNEGAPFSPDTPRIFFYDAPKRKCHSRDG